MKHQNISEIPGWLTSHEGVFLRKAASSVRSVPGSIVEIGSFLGKSTVHLASAGELVYAVDPHKGKFSGGTSKPTKDVFLQNLKIAGVSHFVRPLVKTSASAASAWRLPVKLLFIDGLHDEKHAAMDVALWSPYLVDGGIIAMHDAFCGWEGAGDVAMKRIVNNPEFGEVGVVGSIIYGIKGKMDVTHRVIKLFRKVIIELCQSIYRSSFISKRIQFILVHKIVRILLLNRFSTF